jgi:hypothetical protein
MLTGIWLICLDPVLSLVRDCVSPLLGLFWSAAANRVTPSSQKKQCFVCVPTLCQRAKLSHSDNLRLIISLLIDLLLIISVPHTSDFVTRGLKLNHSVLMTAVSISIEGLANLLAKLVLLLCCRAAHT